MQTPPKIQRTELARQRRVEVSELQGALVQFREDLALKEALLLATDAQLAAARHSLRAA